MSCRIFPVPNKAEVSYAILSQKNGEDLGGNTITVSDSD